MCVNQRDASRISMQEDFNQTHELTLLDYFIILKKRKNLIGSIVLFITITTAIISIFLPKYYSTTAVIMPISNNKGGLSSLASLGAVFGISGAKTQTPSQQFMVLLSSFTLAEEMVNKFHLQEEGQSISSAVSNLRSKVQFKAEELDGTIKVQSEFEDPRLAADVANGYVEGLQNFISKNAFTSAKRNKVFIQGQLVKNKRELLEAGTELSEFYKKGSSVASKMDVFIGEGESSDGAPMTSKNDNHVEGVSQQVYLEYLTARRTSLAQLNALLEQQYEMAKIEEAKDDLAFQIVDPARVPEMRSRPQRRKMVMAAFFGSLLFSIFAALFIEHVKNMNFTRKTKIV